MSRLGKLLIQIPSIANLRKYFLTSKYLPEILQIQIEANQKNRSVSLCSRKGKKNPRHHLSSLCPPSCMLLPPLKQWIVIITITIHLKINI